MIKNGNEFTNYQEEGKMKNRGGKKYNKLKKRRRRRRRKSRSRRRNVKKDKRNGIKLKLWDKTRLLFEGKGGLSLSGKINYKLSEQGRTA